MFIEDFFIDDVRITVTSINKKNTLQYMYTMKPRILFTYFVNCKYIFNYKTINVN